MPLPARSTLSAVCGTWSSTPIGKLRADANMCDLSSGPQRLGPGRPTTYDGKGRIGKSKVFYPRLFQSSTPENTLWACQHHVPAAAVRRRGSPLGVAKLCAVWTCRARWAKLRAHESPGSSASERPVRRSWGGRLHMGLHSAKGQKTPSLCVPRLCAHASVGFVEREYLLGEAGVPRSPERARCCLDPGVRRWQPLAP
jgi:hypothetical protein